MWSLNGWKFQKARKQVPNKSQEIIKVVEKLKIRFARFRLSLLF
jgi:hypothetical protein